MCLYGLGHYLYWPSHDWSETGLSQSEMRVRNVVNHGAILTLLSSRSWVPPWSTCNRKIKSMVHLVIGYSTVNMNMKVVIQEIHFPQTLNIKHISGRHPLITYQIVVVLIHSSGRSGSHPLRNTSGSARGRPTPLQLPSHSLLSRRCDEAHFVQNPSVSLQKVTA